MIAVQGYGERGNGDRIKNLIKSKKTVGFQPYFYLYKAKVEAQICLHLIFYSVIPKCDSPLFASTPLFVPMIFLRFLPVSAVKRSIFGGFSRLPPKLYTCIQSRLDVLGVKGRILLLLCRKANYSIKATLLCARYIKVLA